MANDPPDRDARIDRICSEYLVAAEAGNPPERATWLALHPEYAAELGEFLDCLNEVESRFSSLRAIVAFSETIDQRPHATDHAGNAPPPGPPGYEILGKIAEGGMGVVYRARAVELNRVVALKMIRAADLSGESAVQRFRLEAEATAGFDHPHIVPVYEVGMAANGDPFFSMKLVEGCTLADWILAGWAAGGPLHTDAGIRVGIRLLEEIARAVHYAHQRGFLHRDLKPANILLDSAEVPYVTDFGLVKRLTDTPSGRSLTQTGGMVGTLGYMAPEQARGGKSLTTAVDVYSLGAILFYLLTGRPLRPGRSLAEVSAHLGQVPPRPRTLNPRVDRDLESICLKCLAENPADRLGSADLLAEELGRWLAGRPIATRPPSVARRLRMWARRRPEVAGLAAVAAVLLVSGIGLVTWMWQAEREAKQKESDARREAQAQASRSAAVVAQSSLEEGSDGDPENLATSMLWWSRSFQLAPEGHSREQSSARVNLAALAGRIHTLGEVWQSPEKSSPMRLSPDGRRAAIVELDRVRFIDPRTGNPLGPPLRCPGVTVVAFGPDGDWLAAVGRERFRVWNLGRVPPTPHLEREHSNPIRLIAVGPGGRRVSVADEENRVHLFEGGKPVGEAIRLTKRIESMAFDGSGTRLAVGCADKFARVYDATTGKVLLVPLPHDDAVRAVAFSPDGSKLVTGSDDHVARLWSLGEAGPPVKLEHQDYVRAVAFSPDGRLVATGGSDFAAQVWDASTGRRVGQLLRHAGGIEAVGFTTNGAELVTRDTDGVTRIWTLSEAAKQERSIRVGPDVFALTAAPEDAGFFAGTGRGVYHLDRNRPDHVERIALPGDTGLSVLGGGLAVVGSEDREVWTVGYSSGRGLVAAGGRTRADTGWLTIARPDGGAARCYSFAQPVRSVSFSPSGFSLLVATADSSTGGLWGWNALRPEDAPREIMGGKPAWAVAHRPDGSHYAVSLGDREVHVRRTDSNRPVGEPLRHPWRVVALAYHRDGNRLVTTSTDRRVRVWNATDGVIVSESSAPRGAVWSVALSPDGSLVATAGRDRCVRICDVETGTPVGAPLRHRDVLWAVAFARGGAELWSGSQDGSIHRWLAPNSALPVPDEQIRAWVEVVTGIELEGDRVRVLIPSAWHDRRQRLSHPVSTGMPVPRD